MNPMSYSYCCSQLNRRFYIPPVTQTLLLQCYPHIQSQNDQVYKGNFPRDIPEKQRRVSDYQLKIYDQLVAAGKVISNFNFSFLTRADSREAELVL